MGIPGFLGVAPYRTMHSQGMRTSTSGRMYIIRGRVQLGPQTFPVETHEMTVAKGSGRAQDPGVGLSYTL